jgi:hypothetical protein
MTKQYEITVKILATVSDVDPEAEAMWVAQTLAEMAIKYKSVGADKIVSISAKEVYNERTN